MLTNFLDCDVSRNRDVFPLPLFSVPVIEKPSLSRSVRQRLSKDIQSTKRSNDAISCLNEIFSESCDSIPIAGGNSNLCASYIKSCMSEYSPSDSIRPEEALRTLLGTDCQSQYSSSEDLASTTLVSYQPGKTSLPCISSPPHAVAGMLDCEASDTLVGFEKEMMLDQFAYDNLVSVEGKVKPYIDPVLLNSQKQYETFITELCALHIVTHTQDPKEHTGIFFVKRKDDMQRMIIDCRPTNQHFRRSPNMPIGGAAAWSTASVPQDKVLYCAQYDVQAFFYRCGICKDLSEWFCLPPISQELAQRLWPEQRFDTDRKVYPCLGVLPMGFSWSFWLGQRAHVHISLQSSGLPSSQVFVEGRPAPDVSSQVGLMPYCDNGNVIGTDPDAVLVVRDKLIQALQDVGRNGKTLQLL